MIQEPGRQLTKTAFYTKWLTYVKQGFGSMQAYEKLEDWHFKQFGHRRYASYYSFRQVRDR